MTARLGRWIASLDDFESRMKGIPMVRRYGRLTKITGLVMEAEGQPALLNAPLMAVQTKLCVKSSVLVGLECC